MERPELPTTAIHPLDANQETLVAAMQAGDDKVFAQVVREYGPRMLMVARRFLPQEQDAQDALQDAFLSAFKSLPTFQGDAHLTTWLHRIVVNACLMKLRTRKRRPEQQIEDLLPKFNPDGHLDATLADWAVADDRTVENRELRESVRHAIEQLPEAYRTVLLLRDIEEKSTEQTAQLLGTTAGAIKTRLHRARQALRTLLDQRFDGGVK